MTNEELVQLVQDGIDVKSNMELLYNQNKRFTYKLVLHRTDVVNDIEDLMQQAYFALYNAAMLYNQEEMQCSFITTLHFHVKNEIRKSKSIPAYIQLLIPKYKKIKYDYENEFYCKPSREYLCKQLDIKDDVLTRIQICAHPIQSLNIPVGEESNTELYELIPDHDSVPFDERIEHEELKQILDAAINKLSNREREFIMQEFYNGRTLESIGKQYNISRERVRQVRQEGFRKLRKNPKFMESVQDFRDDLIPIKHVGSRTYNRTRTSSVEWSVLQREKLSSLSSDEAIELLKRLFG